MFNIWGVLVDFGFIGTIGGPFFHSMIIMLIYSVIATIDFFLNSKVIFQRFSLTACLPETKKSGNKY